MNTNKTLVHLSTIIHESFCLITHGGLGHQHPLVKLACVFVLFRISIYLMLFDCVRIF